MVVDDSIIVEREMIGILLVVENPGTDEILEVKRVELEDVDLEIDEDF